MGLVFSAFMLMISILLFAWIIVCNIVGAIRRNPSILYVGCFILVVAKIYLWFFPPPQEPAPLLVIPSVNVGLKLSIPRAYLPESADFASGIASHISVYYTNYAKHQVTVPALLYCNVQADGSRRFVTAVAEPVLRKYFDMDQSDAALAVDPAGRFTAGGAFIYYTLTDPDIMLDPTITPICSAYRDAEELRQNHPEAQFEAHGRVLPLAYHSGLSDAYRAMPTLAALGLQ